MVSGIYVMSLAIMSTVVPRIITMKIWFIMILLRIIVNLDGLMHFDICTKCIAGASKRDPARTTFNS